MDKRLHGDPDRIMEHAEAGYCLSHSEELHLCKYTRSLRSALSEKTAQVERLMELVKQKAYRTIIRCKPAYVINFDDINEALAALDRIAGKEE